MFGLGLDLIAQGITYLRNKAGLINTIGLSVSQTLLYCLGSTHSHLVWKKNSDQDVVVWVCVRQSAMAFAGGVKGLTARISSATSNK